MKSIVTGCDGFIGKYLTSHLKEKNDQVLGFSKKNGIDILNKDILAEQINKFKPDRIFHLAAQSNIVTSFHDPYQTINTNLIGTLNLLEIIKKLKHKCVFVSVGSSSEYGSVSSGNKLNENSPLQPNSPYALSKLSQYHLVRIYRQAYSLNLIHVRPFAIIGPGKEGDAVSDFAKGIVRVEKGETEILEVGDLSNYRDFMDVRDAVRSLEMISLNKRFQIFNICTGKAIQLNKLLEQMLTFSSKSVKIKYSYSKKRQSDDHIIVGDSERLNEIGFQTEYELNTTLKSILEYWRKII